MTEHFNEDDRLHTTPWDVRDSQPTTVMDELRQDVERVVSYICHSDWGGDSGGRWLDSLRGPSLDRVSDLTVSHVASELAPTLRRLAIY